jgi:hypothetical protein
MSDTDPMLNTPDTKPLQETPANLHPLEEARTEKTSSDQNKIIFGVVVVLLLLLAGTIAGVWFLANADVLEVARIRDIFIIFLAVQSLFTGIALIILLIQLAQLINLLKNEVKPILESTNQTVSTLRGTTNFLSNNLVEPVIKLNEYMAGLSTFFQTIGLIKRSSKKEPPKGE